VSYCFLTSHLLIPSLLFLSLGVGIIMEVAVWAIEVINAPKEYCPSAFMRWLKVAVWAMEVDFHSSWRVFPPPSLWVHGGLLVHGGFWRWLCEPWSVIATYIWVVSPPPSLWVHGAYWFMGAFDMKVAVWAMECDCCLHMSGVPPTFLVIYWSYIFSLFFFLLLLLLWTLSVV
jgi:hypothetical protein